VKCTLDERPRIFITDKPIFSSERMLHKGSVVGKHLWSWVSRGLTSRKTDWRYTASRKVTLTLTGAQHQDWLTVSRNVTLTLSWEFSPCRGGVKYLHRSPASLTMRRKEKSRIWESKIRSRVPRDSDPRMTALARASSSCKRRPVLSSEKAPYINKPATVWIK
jgi:hypothetical protein